MTFRTFQAFLGFFLHDSWRPENFSGTGCGYLIRMINHMKMDGIVKRSIYTLRFLSHEASLRIHDMNQLSQRFR